MPILCFKEALCPLAEDVPKFLIEKQANGVSP